MADITPQSVAKLRELTGAGMMDCKKALTEMAGDIPGAVDLLRKKGQASAAKKSLKEAREGVIAQFIQPGAKLGLLAEINCQTDFVARNEAFIAFCDEVVKTLAVNPAADFEARRTELVAKIGENIKIARHTRYEVAGKRLGRRLHSPRRQGRRAG